jgi:predicted phage terminase large subunit-like protein
MRIEPVDYAALLRGDLMTFIERSFYELTPDTQFYPAEYLELMAKHLQDCAEGRTKRLIINLPPRHLKSHCASTAFVAWYLGHYPARHIICASYGQEVADKFARDCRRLMQQAWYQRVFKTRLSDRTAVADFMTTDLGTRMATSVGGVLTGRGADLIIIDDPMKPDEALSETRRDTVNAWYDTTLMSRLNHKEDGVIIIVMQRLHQNDLVGHVLEHEDWTVLSFPAIAEKDELWEFDTPLGRRRFSRRKGEPLHAARESLVTLARLRRQMGEYAFESQYQQNPLPLGGAVVKTGWLKYYAPGEQPAQFQAILQSWDTANKSEDIHDYSVCTTWGLVEDKLYLLDVFREHLDYPALRRAVKAHAERWRADIVLIEDKASGTQLIQDLQEDAVYGVTAYKPPPGSDKLMRLMPQTPMFESGRVLLPAEAPWLSEYVKELTGFPGTRYDDQVDSTTQALAYMRGDHSLIDWMRWID